MKFQEILLQNLLHNGEYSSRVLPYIFSEYFKRDTDKIVFESIRDYILEYNKSPTFEALSISLEKKKINEKQYAEIQDILSKIKPFDNSQNIDWLIKETEKFCQERALENALIESIMIQEGQHKTLDKGAIPEILKTALAIDFNPALGHDYLENAEDRFEYYHRVEEKVPFDLEYLNKITKGGFSKKTLNLFLAGTHVGKTALMCHLAAANLKEGKNVLYITLEMSEYEISKRIDANNMDLQIDEVLTLSKNLFLDKVNRLKAKTLGKLKVKEYPMSTAHIGHFRSFLNDLKLKQGFIPDIIYVDYLNICASMRLKSGGNATSYTYMKTVSEELRALASEFNVPIVSATQVNRTGFGNSDIDMTDISESFGVNFGIDFLLGLVVTDELKERGQVMAVQLKNRYDNMDRIPKFFLGFDRYKMKWSDVADQKSISNGDKPVMDTGNIAEKSDGFKGFKF